jgi:methyl-accepting chemotaxis protein
MLDSQKLRVAAVEGQTKMRKKAQGAKSKRPDRSLAMLSRLAIVPARVENHARRLTNIEDVMVTKRQAEVNVEIFRADIIQLIDAAMIETQRKAVRLDDVQELRAKVNELSTTVEQLAQRVHTLKDLYKVMSETPDTLWQRVQKLEDDMDVLASEVRNLYPAERWPETAAAPWRSYEFLVLK